MEGQKPPLEGGGGQGVTLDIPCPPAKGGRGNQCVHWCATVKANPDMDWRAWRERLEDFTEKYVFQLEKGEGETAYEHWQMYFKLKNKGGLRLLQVKNLLGDNTAHLENCKNITASIKYCSKEDTRIEGPWTETWKEEGMLLYLPVSLIDPN